MGNFRTKSWMDAEAVKKFFVTYYRIGSYTKKCEYTNVTLVSSSNQKLGGLSVNSLKSGKGKLYHDCCIFKLLTDNPPKF